MATGVERSKQDQLLTALPRLRPLAKSLAADPTAADDLLQDTFLRAWSNLEQFEDGTSMQAWLTTILRNQAYTEHRKRRREILDPDGAYAARLVALPTQQARVDFQDVQRAMARLSPVQREALLLIGAEGLPYEAAAELCNATLGTIKSRVNRARLRLSELLTETQPLSVADPNRSPASEPYGDFERTSKAHLRPVPPP
jgi:RNA polymerase sigma-70 factor (ECF subfamily)